MNGSGWSSMVSICFLAFLIWVGQFCLCILPHFPTPTSFLGSTATCTLSHACPTLQGWPIMCSCAIALIVHSQSRGWVKPICMPKSQCPTSSVTFHGPLTFSMQSLFLDYCKEAIQWAQSCLSRRFPLNISVY